MSYHHLALAAKDIKATHDFYERIMGFELVRVEIAPIPGGGWGKHFFYRIDGDDSRFIAFWELNDTPGLADYEYNLNKAAGMPAGTNHYSFAATSLADLTAKARHWQAAGLSVLEIDHGWCHSIYTRDPNGNMIEYCVTTGSFSTADRDRALAALDESEMHPTPPPPMIKRWPKLQDEVAD